MNDEEKKLLTENLGIIKRICSGISYQYLESTNNETELMTVDNTVDPPVFHAGTGPNKISLHSSRRPREEAERQIKQWLENSSPSLNGLVIVLGFAGMHHIDVLLDYLENNAILLVIDIIPELLKKSLLYCDLKKLQKKTENKKLIFIAADNLERIKREFSHYLKQSKTLDISVFIHPGLKRAFPEIYSKLSAELLSETRLEQMNRSTKIALGCQWTHCAMRNLPYALTSPRIDALKDSFKSKTAIMAAAGPSLINSIPFMKEVKDRCVIFCVGTALKPLLEAGLEPDFVVSLDSDSLSLKQFEGIPENKTILLASLVVFTDILKVFKDRILFYSTSILPGYENWLQSFGALPESITVGGTVSLSAIDIAKRAGASQIIFTGLDLATKRDGTTHAKGTMYDNSKLETKDIRIVPGNYENEVNTTPQFACYIKMLGSYLEDAMMGNTIKFYNATDSGAKLANAELIQPWQIPELIPPEKLEEKTEIIESLLHSNASTNTDLALEEIKQAISELNELTKTSESAIETCDMQKENINYNEFNAKMDALDSKIKENQRAIQLTNGAMQGIIWEIQAEPEKTGIDQSKNFYFHLKGTSEWVCALLENAEKICREKINNRKI